MKGIAKAVKRAPQMLGGRVGLAHKSSDAVFDDLNRRFTSFEKYAEKLLKDSSTFRDSVKDMLLSGAGFGASFATLFSPLGDEYDVAKSHPDAVATVRYLAQYQGAMEELRETLTPEVELIESRVIAPTNDFVAVLKAVRKSIVKRDHKLIDYDRHNNAYAKLKDKKEKSLKDEQNLFKVEQEYETAAADYEHYNGTLKEELPRFFEMAARLVAPLFHSFYYMQLNVFYLTLDKLQNFANGKFDLAQNGPSVVEETYVNALNDAAERLEALSIRRPAMPNARILAQGRASGGGHASRTASAASSSVAAAPPAYTSSSSSAAGSALAGKRAPPPPPSLKSKPGGAAGAGAGAAAAKEYVTALYDYTATAEGDLSFRAGDRIELVERTASAEDWWKGVLNGVHGVFPGNYVSVD